jgi:CheY-like chemotaxis protein
MGACAKLKKHILVVDDEPLVAEIVTLLLEWDGHLVDTASSGEEALALFQPGKFDLVITDFLMPTMDGGELAAAIKAQAPIQPVVLLTAFAERFRQKHGLCAIDLVIDKPLPMDRLRQALSNLVSAQKLDCSPSNN